MSTSFHEARTIELGYRIRRAKLEACGGLMIFPHDLETFCIPIEHADFLADAYKRYLCAARILECNFETEDHRQLYECDHQYLQFIHERTGAPFIEGEFSLETSIEFVWLEAKVDKALAIRWCMMMEYVSYEDQRSDELRKRKSEVETSDASDDENITAGGVEDG